MALLPDRPRRRRASLSSSPLSISERCCAVTESDIDGTTDFDSMDFFTNPAFVPDPNPYFEHLRKQGPVVKEPHHGVMAVTGYAGHARGVQGRRASARTAWRSEVRFRPLPFTPEGDDIST